MVRLPVDGGDAGVWDDLLNEFLLVEHYNDGSLKNVARPSDVAAKYTKPGGGIPLSDLTTSLQNSINSIGYMTAPVPLPSDIGYLCESFDCLMANTAVTLVSGTIQLVRIDIRNPQTITNIIASVSTAGSSLTSGQNFAGLYNSSGSRVGVTADQTTTWGSTGVKTMALTAPYAAAAGIYYVALLSNGTTPPLFDSKSNQGAALINGAATAATSRFATNTSGTSLPTSLTLSSNVASNKALWVALS